MKSLKVYGPPGTGKTTRMLQLFEQELKAVGPKNIAFVTFTRTAREEILQRTTLPQEELPYVKTVHAICYQQLGLRRNELVLPKDLRAFGKSIGVQLSGYVSDPWSVDALTENFRQPSAADMLLQMNHLGRHRGLMLKAAMKDAPLEVDYQYAVWFTKAYRAWKIAKDLHDYTDLLAQYLAHGKPPDIKVIFVDEAQDLSWLQWQVVHKLGTHAVRRYLAGDDDQCQPAGEEVLIKDASGVRYVPIQNLNPQKQRVIPYIQGAGFGTTQQFEVACRPYSGSLLNIYTSNGLKSRCTPDHYWLVKWLPEMSTKFVTYLMRQGNWFRIGQCKLQRNDQVSPGVFTNANELQVRVRVEKADAVWILKVHETRKEAYYYEAELVIKYGITDLCFESGDMISLHEFHETNKPNKDSVIKLLQDHGRLYSRPLWENIKGKKRGQTTAWKTAACNIIPDIMSLPTYVGEPQPSSTLIKATHSKVVSISVEHYEGNVYSLNVEKFHTYVSNQMGTCNCIFNWAGASADLFNNEPCDDAEVLPVSYRVPRGIFEVGQAIIRRVKRRFPKDSAPRDYDGESRPIGYLEHRHIALGSTFILFRNHHRGLQLSMQLQQLGWPFRGAHALMGPGTETGDALQGWKNYCDGKTMSLDEAQAIVTLGNKHALRKDAMKRASSGIRVDGRDILTASPVLEDWLAVLPSIRNSAYVRQAIHLAGWAETLDPHLTLQSIHQSKGRQANTVILDLELARRTYEGYMKTPDDEHRVFYVAVTRARERLLTLMPEGGMAYQL